MSRRNRFEQICHAMSDSAFYPHNVSLLERKDTYISTVFLTGRWVYKIKKPVVFDFLDFRYLNLRKRFCELEVSLNQRLSKHVYIKVVKIYEDQNNQISLKPSGRIVEYAVKMVQLPESKNLRELLRQNRINHIHMDTLGHILSAFYQRARHNHDIDQYGKHELIAFNMEENFRELEPFVRGVLDSEKWEFICQASRVFLKHHEDVFENRIQSGRVRDGHGDLRADHIYFHNGIQIIDCIEFNDRFRYGDVVLDLAFLQMDLDHLGYPAQGRELLRAYAEETNDPGIYTLIDFYSAYRAIVRLKVTCFSYGQTKNAQKEVLKQEIKRYMDQAYQYSILFGRPTLWVFFGMPATGKSTLAYQAADAMFIPLLQSDVIRKTDFSKSTQEVFPFNTGLYRSSMRGLVYSHLLAQAQETLRKGKSVILDATFASRKWRKAVKQLARDIDTNLIFVECACKTETIISRLKQRETITGDSGARLIHLQQFMDNFEPFKPDDPKTHFTISTDQPLESMLIQVLSKGYVSKSKTSWTQV